MRIATLALMVRKGKVFLGLKRGGPEIGEGTYNGPGGKMESTDRSILDCLIRETQEEIGVTLCPTRIVKVAVITFCARGIPDFEVHVYLTTRWVGKPRKTMSMIPHWFRETRIPVRRMLESDRAWFRRALSGNKFNATVHYSERAKGFERITFHPFRNHERRFH